MNTLDVLVVVIYLAGMLVIGVCASRRQTNMESYYVAGKKLNAVSVMCLWVSCWIGGASVIGTSTKAYELGITAVWYVGVLAVGCALFALVMAKRVKRIGDRMNHMTYPDFIEGRYDSRCRLLSTICTLVGMVGVTASQLVASGAILNTVTGWGEGVSFFVATAVLILYTAFGGYLAVTYTDWVQVMLLVVGIFLGVPFATKAVGGVQAVMALPHSYFELGSWGFKTILALTVSSILSFFTTMDSYTRCIAARDAKTAKRGGILAAVVILPIAVCATYEGMAARVLIPDIPSGSNPLTQLILLTFPNGIKGLVITGIFAAIMSSGDIAILTGSANLTKDIYQRYLRPDADERTIVRMGVACSLGIGIISALLAWYMKDIMNILLLTFTFLSASLFFPTFFGFFGEKGNADSAFYSMLASFLVVSIWYMGGAFEWGNIFRIDALWPGLLVSGIVFGGLSAGNRQKPEETTKIKEFLYGGNKE